MGVFSWDVTDIELMKEKQDFGLLISALRYKKDSKVRKSAAKAIGDLVGVNMQKKHIIDFIKKRL